MARPATYSYSFFHFVYDDMTAMAHHNQFNVCYSRPYCISSPAAVMTTAPTAACADASSSSSHREIACILFDVDDTLYDKGTQFSHHRNYEGAPKFMVDTLGFPNIEAAKKLRNSYFAKYHSTAKALQQAQAEGAFPTTVTKRFEPKDLDHYFATQLDFTILGGAKSKQFQNDLLELKHGTGVADVVQLVAFSNGPRQYVIRVLQELGLWGDKDTTTAAAGSTPIFADDVLFAVSDTLPHCKPEREAFEKVFQAISKSSTDGGESSPSSTQVLQPHQCIMVEDSMKNIRKAKELGLGTILIVGKGNLHKTDANVDSSGEGQDVDSHDAPVIDDPAVDIVLETIEELRMTLPGLWQDPPVFEPPSKP